MLALNTFNGACKYDRPLLLGVEQRPSPMNLTGPQTGQATLSTKHRLIHGVNVDFSKKLKRPLLNDSTTLNPQSEFRTSDYTSLPSWQNNSFLLDYHANRKQPDTLCHTN